jgi:MFS family permease
MIHLLSCWLNSQRFSMAASIKNVRLLEPKVWVGFCLNFFDHIETAIYLGLGPFLFFGSHDPSSSLWILGLLSSGLGKLCFAFIWSLLFRLFGLQAILCYSWIGLATSSLALGIYGFYHGSYSLSLSVIMLLRFFQSLCSNAQTHACRVWIFTGLAKESPQALYTSAFFGLSTPLGMMSGLALVLALFYLGCLQTLWPWIYIFLAIFALGMSKNLRNYLKNDSLTTTKPLWPKLKEIAICSLISSFGYFTYYWACVFLPIQLNPQNPILAQTQAMAYDTLLMIPLGILSTFLGSHLTLRLCSLGSLFALGLTLLGYLELTFLRGSLLVLGVLCSCSHSAWIKNRLHTEIFFPASLIGGALGALAGSLGFYCAQNQGIEALAMASLPFLAICLGLAVYNEA